MVAERERLVQAERARLAAEAAMPKPVPVRKPKHIIVQTRAGGWQRGEKHHNAKLKDSERRRIIKLWYDGKASQRVLAERFGVNQSTIGHVIRNNQWVMT